MSTPMELLATVLSIAWMLGVALTLAVPWLVGIRLEDALTAPTSALRILQGLSGLAIGVGIASKSLGLSDADLLTVMIPLLVSIWLSAIWRISDHYRKQSPG